MTIHLSNPCRIRGRDSLREHVALLVVAEVIPCCIGERGGCVCMHAWMGCEDDTGCCVALVGHTVARLHIIVDATGCCVRERVLLMRRADARLRSKATTIPATASCKFGARHEVKLSQILLKFQQEKGNIHISTIKMKNPTYSLLVGSNCYVLSFLGFSS